jgi:hypothetical protein
MKKRLRKKLKIGIYKNPGVRTNLHVALLTIWMQYERWEKEDIKPKWAK